MSNLDQLKGLIHTAVNVSDLSDYIDESVSFMNDNPSLIEYGLSHLIREGNKKYYMMSGNFYFDPKYGHYPLWPVSIFIPEFILGSSVGNLSTSYTEYSGLTSPQRSENSNYLWAIEDGATNFLLAINKNTAALAGKITLTGISSSDIEDVTSYRVNDIPYIILADIGDNANARSTIKLFRVQEPVINGSDQTIASVETITCQYPAADTPNSKDCECIIADQITGDIYFITKRAQVSGPSIKCYKLPYSSSYSGTQTLEYMGGLTSDADLNTISQTISGNNGYVVGGDVSKQNREIIIRSYSALYYWKLTEGESIYGALSRTYDKKLTDEYVGGGVRNFHPTQEPQGESVCFDYDGLDVYTCSEYVSTEGSNTSNPLFKYTRLTKETTSASFQNGVNSYNGCSDTYIDSGAATSNFGTINSLVADLDFSSYPTISRRRESLVKWDISSIPSGSTVTSAYLVIYINTEGKQIELDKITQSWDANLITYTNNGGPTQTDGSPFLFGTTKATGALDGYVGFSRINIPLSIAQDWVSNPSSNNGLVIRGGPQESTGDGLQFDSCESTTQSRRPKLVIRYY